MRRTIISFMFLACLHSRAAFAAEWTVVSDDGQYFAVLPDFPKLKIKLKSLGGVKPRPIKNHERIPEAFPNIRLFAYEAGNTGATRIVTHFRVLILDIRTTELLGDVPSGYFVSTTPRAGQPRWEWNLDELVVNDSEFGRQVRIPLRK